MILETIKLAVIYFIAIIAALIIGSFLGNPGYGIILLIGYAGFQNYRSRKTEKLEQEDYTSQRTLTQNGLLTKVTDQNGVTTVHAHKRYGGTEQDILDFINDEKR